MPGEAATRSAGRGRAAALDERADRRAARRRPRPHRVQPAGPRLRAASTSRSATLGLGLEKRTALYWAIGGSVASALAIGVFRLARRQPVRHAVNGLFGIAIGAYLAWRTGKAEDFYLPGILLTFGQAAVLLLSVVVRKPLIGYAWGVMANKGHQDWFGNARLFRTFQWLTLVWVVSLCLRAGIQLYLWAQHEANALGIVRILISWPIYAATFAYTAWAIHRVTTAQRAEAEAGA